MKTKAENILAMTIGQIGGLSAQTRNYMLIISLQHKHKDLWQSCCEADSKHYYDQEKREGAWKPWNDLVNSKGGIKGWVEDITVRDVVDAWNDSSARAYFCSGTYGYGTDTSMKKFMIKLVELGLTKLDWPHLYPLDKAELVLTKEEWLDQSIFLLETLTPKALERIEQVLEKGGMGKITVRDLLQFVDPRHWCDWYASREKTVARLRELGFTHVDGPFIPVNLEERRQLLLETLVAEDGLSRPMAEKFLFIAIKRRWA